LDGVAIAATFFVSIPLGIVTAIAVFAHEVPQEIGDFGLLLHRGLSRRKVIVVNVISALFAFLGAIIAILLGSSMQQFLPIALSLTAGFFIYIALSDIIPGIHHEHQRSHIFKDTLMLLLGVLVVGFSIAFLEIK
jgi:zinc and cadmium transporter